MKPRIIFLCSILLLIGCNSNNVIEQQQNQMLKPPEDEFHDQLGYVHYTKNEVNNETEQNKNLNFNRKEIANMITRTTLKNDGFNEVATLVTDKEALIAFDINEKLDDHTSRDIAEKIAKTILPGFFKVYTSSNQTLIHDIHSLHNSRTTRNDYDQSLKQIIEQMEK